MYLEAVNLKKRYGKFVALKSLNLKVEGRKCVGYLGPNGAGKTTTLKLFTRLLNPSGGEAIIDGYSVFKEPKRALSNVGTLIEMPGLYPYLTPEENLRLICELRLKSDCDIKGALEAVRMYEWRNKRVGKFSKGMIQRVALAAALVTDPEILILDEPTSGMDPRGMAEIRNIIKSLKKDSKLIFMSSHLLSEVTEVCDEVAMLNHGTLLLYDSVNSIVERYRSSAVELTTLTPVDLSVIQSIEGVKSAEQLAPNRVRIEFDGGAEQQYRILNSLLSREIKVIEYRSSGMALENAYLKLIGGEAHE